MHASGSMSATLPAPMGNLQLPLSTPKAFPAMGAAAIAGRGGSAAADASGPLTFQVYTPDALPMPRMSRMSIPDGAAMAPKASAGKRIALALVAACVVAGTTALIIVGASDDAPRPAKRSTPTVSALAPTVLSTPAPVVTAPPVPEAWSVAAAEAPASAKPVASAPRGAARPRASSGASRGGPLPPNPFGSSAGAKKKDLGF